MPGEGEIDIYRELVETKIENGLNDIKGHTERVLSEAQKNTDADLKVIKDECDQIQMTLERVSTQITELASSFRTFKDNLPQAIDDHLEHRHKSFIAHAWSWCCHIFNYLPQVLAAIVSIIIIWAWMTGKLSALDAATGIGL